MQIRKQAFLVELQNYIHSKLITTIYVNQWFITISPRQMSARILRNSKIINRENNESIVYILVLHCLDLAFASALSQLSSFFDTAYFVIGFSWNSKNWCICHCVWQWLKNHTNSTRYFIDFNGTNSVNTDFVIFTCMKIEKLFVQRLKGKAR